MLVNVNCPYSYRDTVFSEPNIQRKEEKKLEFYALLHRGLAPSSFQYSSGSGSFFFFPTEHGDVDSIKFFLKQEAIRVNLELKA